MRQPRKQSSEVTSNSEKKGTQAIDRALDILSCFNFSHPVWHATELSTLVGLTLSTTQRILKALESKGMLLRNPKTGTYELGLRAFELGAVASSRISLISQSKEILVRLREETNETVHLVSVYGDEMLYLTKIESSDAFGVTSPDGIRRPLTTGALGKAILSTYPPAMLEAYLAKHRLGAYTSRSITDPNSYIEELAKVRDQGFSVDREELFEGICGVGAPIVEGNGPAIGGISVAFPALRFDQAIILKWAQLVRQAVLTISYRLSSRTLLPQQGTFGPRTIEQAQGNM